MTTRLRVGVIGLGAMGAPMARRFHAAGWLHAVWNRTPAKAAALVGELAGEPGVIHAESPAELARTCQLVLTSVSADADLQAVVEAMVPGCHADLTVVDTSTVAVDTARRMAARLAEHGTGFLDAPVSGGVEGARRGSLVMMVGGAAEVLERVRPALAALATDIRRLGEVGAGQAAKAVNQVMAAGINEAVTEALALGEAAGLPLDALIDLLGGGAAGNWFLDHRGPTMVRGEYAPGFRLALHHKDLVLCQQLWRQLSGAESPLVATTLGHYETLMTQGRGDEDISALYRLKCSRRNGSQK